MPQPHRSRTPVANPLRRGSPPSRTATTSRTWHGASCGACWPTRWGKAELVADGDRVRLRAPARDLATVGDAVALTTHELLTGDKLHRVKHCAQCHWLFLDRSKNGSRRWCSTDDCGTSVKMRRYVGRRAARRTSAP